MMSFSVEYYTYREEYLGIYSFLLLPAEEEGEEKRATACKGSVSTLRVGCMTFFAA
jgi:hypothetical protein